MARPNHPAPRHRRQPTPSPPSPRSNRSPSPSSHRSEPPVLADTNPPHSKETDMYVPTTTTTTVTAVPELAEDRPCAGCPPSSASRQAAWSPRSSVRVDSPRTGVAGGAITGTILGFAQWLGMRRTGPSAVAWIIATAVGFAVGLGLGAAAVGYHDQHRCTRHSGRDLRRRHRRRPSRSPVPHARTNRASRGQPLLAGCGRSAGRSLLRRHRRRSPVHRVRFQRSDSSSPPLTSILPIALARRQQRTSR